MTKLRTLASRVSELLLRRHRDARLDEEVQAHLDLLADEHIAQGMSPHDARVAARKAFGGVDQVKALYRDQRGLPFVDALWQDVRVGVRMLIRDSHFTAVAALALALGMAATTAMFTIVNGMNLRDLPFDDPDEVVALSMSDARGRRQGVSYVDYLDWREGMRTLRGIAAHAATTMNLGDDERAPERFSGAFVTANAFPLLGERPALGRGILPEDERPGATSVVLLGHGPWTDRYGADPSIVGRTIRVNGVSTVVIGIMPAGFRFPVESDVWQPLGQMPGLAPQSRNARTLGVVGRLAEGVTLPQARTELTAIAARLADAYPDTNADMRARLVPLNEHYYGSPWQAQPVVLMGSAFFVLLIGCANAASLLLARSARRAREIALRAALGASRGRLVRQLLVESVLLAAVASVVGLGLSRFGVHLFRTETTNFGMPYWTIYPIDFHVFGFLVAVCLASAILFGLMPAWHLSKTKAHDVLRERGSTVAGSRRAHRWSGRLLAGELALTLTLLAGAGLLLRSAQALHGVDQVVDATDVVTMQLTLPAQQYATADTRRAFYDRLEARLSALPEIFSAAIAGARPFAPHGAVPRQVERADDASPSAEELRTALTVAIGPRYFETLGVALVRGRTFDDVDGTSGQAVSIVNQRFAAMFFPGDNPIGRRIHLADERADAVEPSWLTIVGVSPSVRQSAGGDRDPVVYLPLRAQPQPLVALIVRGPPGGGATAVLRGEVRAIDGDLPLYNVMTLERLSAVSRWPQRSTSFALTLLGGIALLLSAAGLYGVTAYSVTERTREIGVRMAVGARPAQVARLVLRRSLVPLAIGLCFGVAGAIAVGRVVQGLLVETSPSDPVTVAGVVLLLVTVALSACLIPTRRATRLDPASVLRHE